MENNIPRIVDNIKAYSFSSPHRNNNRIFGSLCKMYIYQKCKTRYSDKHSKRHFPGLSDCNKRYSGCCSDNDNILCYIYAARSK